MNLKQKYSLTVGIPFYSQTDLKYLQEAIDSVLNQTIIFEKLHLIQDGPVSAEISDLINKYKDSSPDLIQIILLPAKGLPNALNHSIGLSDTTYYARMDSDDIALDNRFEIQLDFLEKNPNLDILGSWAYEFEYNRNKEKLHINKTPKDKIRIKEYFHYRNPLIHPSVIFRVDVFKKIGLYNESMYTDQDLELWSRALKHGINISNIEKPLIFFRTEGRLKKRSKLSAIKRQILIRYSYNTCSFKLNVLKLAAIILRLLPLKIRRWSYKNLRNN